MNRIFRVIWSHVFNAWTAVSEITKGRGKSTTKRKILITAIALTVAPLALAEPTGGQVASGSGTISQAGSTTNIQQSSQNLSLNWQTFNVSPAETINYVQPSATAIAVNRIFDTNGSQILGHLNANGQVWLINPNGVLFGQGAQVNVGGLVASTLDFNDAQLGSGSVDFSGNGTGSIINQGAINAAIGGSVALLGNHVSNQGVIVAQLGSVALGAGSAATLTFNGNSLVHMQVDQSTLDNLAENGGLIKADGGQIVMTAGAQNALLTSVVNNTGILEARAVENQNGTIILSAGMAAGTANVGGTVDVSSANTSGGHIIATANNVLVADNATLNATGATGGGTINIGGGWQGSGNIAQATTVYVSPTATIDASATNNGNGGLISVWSDVANLNSSTLVYGTLLSRGGVNGGNGGNIETSGHQVDIGGVCVNAGATKGNGGLWLIDPFNYIIGSTQASTIVGNASSGLNSGTSVTVDTSGSDISQGSSGNNLDAGDITVTAAIGKTLGGDATLTLKAARHIVLQSGANFSSSSGKLNLQFWADSDNSGDGINMVSATSIGTNGGSIKFGNNQIATINGSSVLVGGDVFFNGASAQTLSTGGGDLNIYGETILANSSGVTINTSGGNVTFSGVLNSGNQYTWVDETANLNHDWNWARTDAKNLTAGGSALNDSYLVTITSRLENAIAGLTAGYRGAWIGAYRANPTSSFAWTWADGPEAGVQFYTQNSSGGSGTTSAGYYSNYGSGEPNGTLAANESVGQFFGTAGQWNDLSQTTIFSATQGSQYNVLGYVRETNLAPTALTINSGSGTVLFNNSVGGSKALASLTVTGATTLPNSITTTGTQIYNGAVLLAANTTLTTTNSDITFGSTVNSADAANPKNLTTNILADPTYYWVDWTSSDTTHVYGTITIGGSTINVTYSNPNGFFGAQIAGGTNFWTGLGGAAFVGASPYVSANVANGPVGSDIIQLQYAGSQTLTFSQSVENLAFSIVSMNGNGYGFNQNFNIASYSGYNGAGSGYWGAGNMVKTVVGSTYQLNDGGMNASSVGHSEPHGTIRFTGGFSQLTWQSLSNEIWNGFTVGVSGTSATAGVVHFNGTAGGSAALGAVTVNGALQTTANISGASSFNVTGNSNLGGNITTSGVQSFGSAVTLSSDVTLTTTANGSINTTSSIDGAHVLTVSTNGTGNTTFGGAVGSTTALTGLSVTTNVLNAGAIALAASSAFDVTHGGSSSITGGISGTGVTLTKVGSGTLTLSGANSYTGATNIASGELIVQNDAPVTASSSFNGPGSLTIQSSGTGFASTFNTHGWNFGSTLGGLTIGKSTNTADVILANATSIAGPINIYGGNIAVLGDLASTGTNNLTLTASSNILLDGNVNIGGLMTANVGGNFLMGMNLGTAAGTTITANGGFVKTGTGTSYLTGNITTSGTDINIAGPVQIADFNGGANPLTLASGGGNIILGGAVSNYSGTAQSYALAMANSTALYSGATVSAVAGSGTDVVMSYTTAGSNVFWGMTGMSLRYLLVGGGGGSGGGVNGQYSGGGGGGGGVFDSATASLLIAGGTPYSVAVGTGGTSGNGPSNNASTNGANGGDSGFDSYWVGGGGGGGASGNASISASSGFGGTGNNNPSTAGRTYLAGGGGGGGGGKAGGDGAGGAGGTSTAGTYNGAAGAAGGQCTNCGNVGGGAFGSAGLTTGVGSNITGSTPNYGVGGGGTVGVFGTGGFGANYPGAVTAQNGAVVVRYAVANGASNAASALKLNAGSGSVTLSSSASNLSNLEINAGIASSITGAISGTGSTLTNSGAGILTVNGASTYTGATAVTSSGIVFNNDAAPTTSGFTGAGTVTIQSSSTSFTNDLTASYTFASTLTGLTLGKSGNTKNITLASATSIAGPINIYAGNISITNTLGNGSTAAAINLTASGSITESGLGLISTTGTLTTNSVTGATLTGANTVATFNATNTTSGDILLTNTADPLIITGMSNTGNGADTVSNAGAISITGAIVAAGGAVNLTATGASGTITESGSGLINTTGALTTSSVGTTTLNNANTVGHFGVTGATEVSLTNTAATLGLNAITSSSLTVNNTGALTVGSAINAGAGTVSLSATDNLALNSSITTTDASSSAIVLKAGNGTAAGTSTGGDITVSGGSLIYGGGGRATLYTGSVAGSTTSAALVGSGSGKFRYNSNATTTNYTLALGAGTYEIYREQPTLTITPTGPAITYSSAIPSFSMAVAGANGDTASQALSTQGTVATDGVVSASGNLTATTHTLTASGAVDQLGYALSYATGSLVVNKLALAGTAIADVVTTYGTPAAAGAVSFGNIVGVDNVTGSASVNTSTTSSSGNFVAGSYTQSASTTLGGTDKDNYSFAGFTTAANYTISKLALTSAAIAGVTTTYGTPAAAGVVSFGNVIGSDLVSSAAIIDSPTYSTSNNLKTGSYTQTADTTLTNTDAGNYSFAGHTSTANYTVGKLALTGAAIAGVTTTYGTLAAAGAVTFGNVVGSDLVSSTASIDSPTYSTGNNLKASSYTQTASTTLTNTDAGNYDFAGFTSTANYTVGKLSLNVSGISAVDKVYDANAVASLIGTASVNSLSSDIVNVNGLGNGVFGNPNVANGKGVTVTGYTLLGADSSNYDIVQPTGLTANVTAAPLIITANADSKLLTQVDVTGYNGVNYSGLVGGEPDAVIAAGTITRTGMGVGSGANDPAGSYAGVLVPAGYSSGNYDITYVNGSYTIVPADQLLVKVTNSSATYGTAPVFSIVSAEYLNGSNVLTTLTQSSTSGNTSTWTDGAGGSATFTLIPSAANTSTSGNYVVGNYAVTGGNTSIVGGNFTALNFVGNLAVTQQSLTASASNVGKVYDSTTAMTGVTLGLAGLLTNDAVTAGGAGSFSSYHVGSGLGYSINDIALSGSDAGNYYLSGTTLSGNNGLITPATLTISGITASDKVYNANTATTVSTVGAVYGGLFSGDNVTVAATGVFGDQNVGTNKVVTLSSNYTGSNVGDYAITDQASTTANITPAPLTVIGTVVANKVYDGTTAATLTGGTLSGTVYTGDSVTLATEAGNFTSPNAGTGISVTGADVLGGSSAGNYTLIQPTGLVADITSALLSNAQAGATQLISTVLSPSYAQPQSIAILPTLTITQVTSSDAEGVTDSPSGTKANEQRMSGETGATLKIENGGIKLPTIKMNPLEPSVAVEENTSNEEAMARLPIEVPEVMLVDKEKAFANALLATHQRSLPVMTVTYPVSLDDANFDNFDASSIVILSKAIPRLERVLKYASANPKANFEVSGHADKRASSKALYNMQLSERRANAVKEYLVAHGVAAERIVVKGYGFENPTADNGTKVGRAQNRRVGIRYLPAESNK